MDLRKFRSPAVFFGSFLCVCLFSCVPAVGLVVGCIGKIVVTLLIGVCINLFLRPQLDRFFNRDGQTKVDPKRKAVFITGCDTGFGHELALQLHRLGFHVYAGCLFPNNAGAKKLRDRGVDGRLRVVPCDVTNMAQVSECATRIGEELNKMQIDLWAIVNNAGIAALSEFEWIPIEVYEKILNINSLGSVRVVKAFLPMLRKSKGRIVMVSSLSGRYAVPGFTGYSMSKHAQIALADGLRRELKKFKIQVCLIEPGSYKTNLADVTVIKEGIEKHWGNLPKDVQNCYGPAYLEKFVAHLGHLAGDANTDLSEPIEVMIHAVTAWPEPELRYVPGDLGTKLRGMFLPLLPLWLQDILMSRLSIGIPSPTDR